MGHVAKADWNRCTVLDELEAAITRKQAVRVLCEDGLTRSGQPLDVYTENHEDFLQLKDHLPIAISRITRVEKL